MYIIDRNVDFYDHYSHVYGLDKSIVFDRRGSVRLTDDVLVKTAILRFDRDTKGSLLLEIGDVQYLLHLYEVVYDHFTISSYKISLLHTYNEHRHLNDSAVMSVRGVRLYSRYTRNFGRIPKKIADIDIPSLDELARRPPTTVTIDLPILADTKLTSVLNAEEIWQTLQNYISSLDNDKDVSIPMTDKDKAAIHGFDKHSFRHPIKL